MQYNKKPHQDKLTVAETIKPLRLNMAVASKPLTLSCMCKTVPQRATTPSIHSVTTPGTRMPTTLGRTWVEKEKWKTFRRTCGSSGAVAGNELGGRWTIGWELWMMLRDCDVGDSEWGQRIELTILGRLTENSILTHG
jgi:hypothetical protein